MLGEIVRQAETNAGPIVITSNKGVALPEAKERLTSVSLELHKALKAKFPGGFIPGHNFSQAA